MNSPCDECKHRTTWLETTDAWAGNQYIDDCEEGAPGGVFMSEWGCWRYEERPGED